MNLYTEHRTPSKLEAALFPVCRYIGTTAKIQFNRLWRRAHGLRLVISPARASNGWANFGAIGILSDHELCQIASRLSKNLIRTGRPLAFTGYSAEYSDYDNMRILLQNDGILSVHFPASPPRAFRYGIREMLAELYGDQSNEYLLRVARARGHLKAELRVGTFASGAVEQTLPFIDTNYATDGSWPEKTRWLKEAFTDVGIEPFTLEWYESVALLAPFVPPLGERREFIAFELLFNDLLTGAVTCSLSARERLSYQSRQPFSMLESAGIRCF